MATAAVAVLAAALCLSAGSDPPLSVASLATTQITLRWQRLIEKSPGKKTTWSLAAG